MKALVEKYKRLPLSPWLFVTFFFSHAFIRFFDWLTAMPVLHFYLIALGVVTLLYVGINAIFKSPVKTTFVLNPLIAFVLYFISIHTLINRIPFVQLSSWVLIPLVFALFGLAIYWLNKKENPVFLRLNYFFNLLFTLFVLADAVEVYIAVSKKKATLQIVQDGCNTAPVGSVKSKDSLPDIYFLVFDEYASSVSLKKNFNFDNSGLDTFLLHKGFFIAKESKSNYALTVFSIASTFHQQYFKDLKEARYPDDYPAALESMQTNRLFSQLEQLGYTITNHSIFELGQYKSKQTNFFHRSAFSLLFSRSMIKQFKVLYWYLTPENNLKEITQVMDEVVQPNNDGNPSFKYFHVLLPHYPFVFRADGSVRSAFEYTRKKDNYYLDKYLEQLTYTNSLIRDFITRIMNSSDRPKIIVLEGDHGLRFPFINRTKSYDQYRKNLGPYRNLNAYYFYDKNYTQLHDSISPVNTFRVISNQYLGLPCGLLPDKSIF